MVAGEGDPTAAVTHAIGRAVLSACVRVLEPAGVRVMPLKGIWLQEFVYAGSGGRAITDVDVLVEDGAYRHARRALEQAGWRCSGSNVSEATLHHASFPLPIDLHARLFTPGAFRVAVAPLFARSTSDSAVFGVPVALPDPLDVVAHLVGHALKSGSAWSRRGQELRDIPLAARRLGLCARACALRLSELGLARAARFVLPLTAAYATEPFAAGVLRWLPHDPLGAALNRGAVRLQTASKSRPRLAAPVGFALDSSLPRGAYALTLRVRDKLRERAGFVG